MKAILHLIDVWWSVHPHIVDLGIAGIAILASLYSKRSRQLVEAPFVLSKMGVMTGLFYTGLGIARFMQRDSKNHIEILNLVEKSPSHLIAYLVFYALHAFFLSIKNSIVLLALWGLFRLLYYWHPGHTPPPVLPPWMVWVVFSSTLIGRAGRLYFFVNGLLHPESFRKMLEDISSDKLPTGLKDAVRSARQTNVSNTKEETVNEKP